MLNEKQKDGGYPEEERDSLGFQELQRPGRFKGALYDYRAPHVQHGQGKKAYSSDVKHGEDRQVAILAGEAHAYGEIDGVPEAGPLAQHRPLGLSRGACGVHDDVGGIQFRGLIRIRFVIASRPR